MSEHRPAARPVEEVVDAVATTADDRDRVREALDPIVEADRITREAVERAVSDTAKLVATAETRTELAGMAYDDATVAAADVQDLPLVAARLESYEQRLADVEDRAAGLGALVPSPDDTLNPEALHDIALDLREAATSAQGVSQTADDLSWDLEVFESWLNSPERRYEELAEDVDLVDESVAKLTEAIAALPEESNEPAADWAEATMQTRVLELLVTDLRAELTDLREWADREDVPFRTVLDERVTAVEQRVEDLDNTLDARAEPAWRERFEDGLAAFDRELEGFESPVDWGRVQETLSEQREVAIGGR